MGDSISSLCGTVPAGGWCGPLTQILTDAGVPAVILNRAVSGTDCGYAAANINGWLAADTPDLVIVACGTNEDTSSPAAVVHAGEHWRTIIEAAHIAGALTLPVFIQYSNPTLQAAAGRTWLVPGEQRFNDQVVYQNLHYYQPYGWFAGLLDLQQVPSSADYTLRTGTGGVWDGIHPTALGYQVYAALIYRELRNTYGWPDTVPQPCGMTGEEARGPAYEPYISQIQCIGKLPG